MNQQVLDRRHQFVALTTPVVLEDGQTGGFVLVLAIEAGLDALQLKQFSEIERPLKTLIDQFMIAAMEPVGIQCFHLIFNCLRIATEPAERRSGVPTITYEG